jgi:hypothetical protein
MEGRRHRKGATPSPTLRGSVARHEYDPPCPSPHKPLSECRPNDGGSRDKRDNQQCQPQEQRVSFRRVVTRCNFLPRPRWLRHRWDVDLDARQLRHLDARCTMRGAFGRATPRRLFGVAETGPQDSDARSRPAASDRAPCAAAADRRAHAGLAQADPDARYQARRAVEAEAHAAH